MSKYLMHHGIKGQKWGVRRGPPYPIEDTVLKKGTRLNSVSTFGNSDLYKQTGTWMYTYNPDDEWDKKVYEGPFTVYLIKGRGARFVQRHKYETVKDLTMPTSKQRIDEFKNIYDNPRFKKQTIKELDSVRKTYARYGNPRTAAKYNSVDLKNLKTEEDFKIAYEIFGHAMEASYNYISTKEYVKNISAKYDAMVDDNNVNRYNEVHDPIIIFNANEVLKTYGNTSTDDILWGWDPKKNKPIMDQVVSNYKDVEKELNKKGKNVML